MIELTEERSSNITGSRTRFWTVRKNGVEVGQLAKGSEAFAKWRFMSIEGGVAGTYRNDLPSKTAALAFIETL